MEDIFADFSPEQRIRLWIVDRFYNEEIIGELEFHSERVNMAVQALTELILTGTVSVREKKLR